MALIVTPIVWAGYGLAREANREVDTGVQLNPGAIAAAGALSAIPGTIATKASWGLAGKIGAGLAAGYGSDLANQVVQQWGDTGQVDPSRLDYRPGLGTAIGGLSPVLKLALSQYIALRKAQALAGKDVDISYEDFVAYLKKQNGWTDQDILYYTNQSTIPPSNHPYNRPIWSPGPMNNPLYNAYEHSLFENHAAAFGLKPGDPRYVQATHDLLDELPTNTELMETKAGVKRYYSPGAGPNGQNIFTVEDVDAAPRTSYTPDGKPEEQYNYFRNQGGKYKGRIK